MTDELTGMPNRRKILEFLGRELRAAPAGGDRLNVMAFDVDHFKRINDLHGHHVGDQVLCAIATSSVASFPPVRGWGGWVAKSFWSSY